MAAKNRNNGAPGLTLDQAGLDAARRDLKDGAVTPAYGPWRDDVVRLLNEALATELVCVMRYRRHHYTASGLASPKIAEEFLVHANAELAHADRIAERIVQLGGAPDFNPDGLASRSHSEYREGDSSLIDMIKEDLVAERVAIESYREIIQFVGIHDPTTRRMLESVLAKEEEHAEELRSMLEDISKVLGEKQARTNGGN